MTTYETLTDTMGTRNILLIGDHEYRDFRDVAKWLAEHTRLTTAATIDDAMRHLSAKDHYEAIIFAQSRPSQFSARAVESLHITSPLSRLVALLGSWCEGEMRTGHPWPGVIRIKWHQWKPRLIPQLHATENAPPGNWTLPRTASVAERMAVTADVVWPQRQGLIAIHAQTFRDYHGLSEACSQSGYSTAWYSPAQTLHASGFAGAVFDGIGADDSTMERLGDLVQQMHPAPVVALLDYVRRQDFERTTAAGVAAVIAKPLLTYDLLWHLEDQIGGTQRQPVAASTPQAQSPVTSAA